MRGLIGTELGQRGTLFAYKLTRAGEAITGTLLWQSARLHHDSIALAQDDLFITPYAKTAPTRILDATTGTERVVGGVMNQLPHNRDLVVTDNHVIALSAGHVDHKDRDTRCIGTLSFLDRTTLKPVGTLTIPVEQPEGKVLDRRVARVARNWWYGENGDVWGCDAPMPWGNRIIVRNNNAVYCLGMPGTTYQDPQAP